MARARRGRGEGSVYQRESDGLWVGTASLEFDGTGKRRRKTVYGKTKTEALAKLRVAHDKTMKGTLRSAKSMPLGEFLAVWLSAIKSAVAPGTHAAYAQHVKNLIAPK